ncbi:hypothetical protein NIES2104_32290 [Leptolyngbya sp. NIES-2104]|nr:hypothetical protein NIES2104_32290 [Leptolyngbya sp. NIES-2104]
MLKKELAIAHLGRDDDSFGVNLGVIIQRQRKGMVLAINLTHREG